MTIALIVLVIFLVVWTNDSAKKRAIKHKQRKNTITNVQLQDRLFQKYFLRVIADLEYMDKETPLIGEPLLDALEFLYELYDIPDRRSNAEKINQRSEYLNDICTEQNLMDGSELSISKKIWYNHWQTCAPLLNRPDLLVGIPNTRIIVNGVSYNYDFRGIPVQMYCSIPANIIGDIVVLLTIRDLNQQGYNYSWNRQESDWQSLESELKEYDEKKEQYPWLYK